MSDSDGSEKIFCSYYSYSRKLSHIDYQNEGLSKKSEFVEGY